MRYQDPVVILRAPLVEGYGGQLVRNWDEAVPGVALVNMQPESTTEVTDSRQLTITRWRCFGPADLDLLATDRVQWTDLTLEVDGELERWGRRGRPQFVKAVLKIASEEE